MALVQIPVIRFNPYNSIGDIHNKALDYVAANAPSTYTIDDIFTLGCSSVLQEMKGPQGFDQEELLTLVGTSVNIFNTLFLPPRYYDEDFVPINVEGIINAGAFNETQAYFMRLLANPSRHMDIHGCKEFIKSIETNILSSNLTDDEMFPLLCGTAIGKSSCDYWEAVLSDPNNPYYPFVAQRPWWKFVLSDAFGAMGGIGGAIIGAIGGAVGATLAYAFCS